jgi:hypothetical protein
MVGGDTLGIDDKCTTHQMKNVGSNKNDEWEGG